MKWAALIAAALAVAAPSSAAPRPIPWTGQIDLTAKLLTATSRTEPPRGRANDHLGQVWSLRDEDGHPIARYVIWCRWVTAASRLCVGQVKMPLGTIQVGGASQTSFGGVLAVVGGTGVYLGVGGDLRFTAIGAGRMILMVNLVD